MSWKKTRNGSTDIKNESLKQQQSEQQLSLPSILNLQKNEIETDSIAEIDIIKTKNITQKSAKNGERPTESDSLKLNVNGTAPTKSTQKSLSTQTGNIASHGEVLPSFYEKLQMEEEASLNLTRDMGKQLHGLMTKLIEKKEEHDYHVFHSGDVNDVCKVAAELTKIIKARTDIIRTAGTIIKPKK